MSRCLKTVLENETCGACAVRLHVKFDLSQPIELNEHLDHLHSTIFYVNLDPSLTSIPSQRLFKTLTLVVEGPTVACTRILGKSITFATYQRGPEPGDVLKGRNCAIREGFIGV